MMLAVAVVAGYVFAVLVVVGLLYAEGERVAEERERLREQA